MYERSQASSEKNLPKGERQTYIKMIEKARK
jgi:hypothetical protein